MQPKPAAIKGWKPDVPDQRDLRFKPRNMGRQAREFDLRDRFFRCWQQGSLGSCTAQTVAAACLFRDVFDRDNSIVVPSRLFIYYATRSIEGTTDTDAGAEIRNAIKSVVKFGYPPEESWPYLTSRFSKKPPAKAFKIASTEKIRKYERVSREISHFRKALIDGFPIALGFSVYESIYQGKVEKTGMIPLPKRKEKLEGGHAVLAVGYSDSRKALIIRNSWGTAWGQNGYGFLPYEFIENPDLSDDFWLIR
jgi:C1A family cysteine protease